jgi:hypothetical protein
MWIFAAISLLFALGMAWMLLSSLREGRPNGMAEYFLTVSITSGTASTVVVAIPILWKAWA